LQGTGEKRQKWRQHPILDDKLLSTSRKFRNPVGKMCPQVRAPARERPCLGGSSLPFLTGAPCFWRSGRRLEPPGILHSQAGAWERVPMGIRPPRITKSWITGGASIRRGARASCPHQPASCRRAGDGVGLHSARAQASGRMPKAAGWKPALPVQIHAHGYFRSSARS